MQIRVFEDYMIEEVIELWNKNVAKNTIYKEFSKKSFEAKFISNQFFDYKGTLVMIKDNKIIGFGNAVTKDEDPNTPGFITCVVIEEKYQRRGYGSLLLKDLESYLKTKNKTFVRQIFLSPINLEWIIPNTLSYNHPGTPAVPFNSQWYYLLINNGYNVNEQQQDAYYMKITYYTLPEKIKIKNQENEKDGYKITFYDKEKHYGFEEFFSALKNESWHNVVKNNISKKNPNPMLVVVKDNEILGWTGPLYTEESKRGYFAGIGVHPKVQGRGLGKSLFCELVLQSKNNGAEFMSLFTGSQNPARNIYLQTGFKIVQSFGVLSKKI